MLLDMINFFAGVLYGTTPGLGEPTSVREDSDLDLGSGRLLTTDSGRCGEVGVHIPRLLL